MAFDTNRKITLIVPTLNRSGYIVRYLKYLQNVGFDGCFLIGDSSCSHHLERTRKAIRTMNLRFHVVHEEYPGLKAIDVIRNMLPMIKTPFSMFTCDDDLLIPNALNRAADFLNLHAEYSGVGGVSLAISEEGGRILGSSRYNVRAIEGSSASDRLIDVFNPYSVVGYSLARSEDFKERFPLETKMNDGALSTELFPCAMLAVQGKIKMMEELFMVRQVQKHPYRLNEGFIDWITDFKWGPSYRVFVETLAHKISQKDNVSINEAIETVKRGFNSRIRAGIESVCRRSNQPQSSHFSLWLKKVAKKIPGSKLLWDRIYSRNKPFSLRSLLLPTSKFHSDFLPVYHVITSSPL